jgi:hypothetical protein
MTREYRCGYGCRVTLAISSSSSAPASSVNVAATRLGPNVIEPNDKRDTINPVSPSLLYVIVVKHCTSAAIGHGDRLSRAVTTKCVRDR